MSNDTPRYPSEVSTRDRSEMVCPECFTQGLEANPAFEGEYSGDTELLKATRCPNPDCPKHNQGLDQREVREQLSEKSITDRVVTLFGIGGGSDNDPSSTSNTNTSSSNSSAGISLSSGGLLQAAVVVGGALLLITQVLGIGIGGIGLGGLFDGGAGGDASISGQLDGASGNAVTDTKIVLAPDGNISKGYNTTAGADGRFTVENVPEGEYTIFVEPRNGHSAQGVQIDVTADSVSVQSGGTYENNSIIIPLQNASTTERTSARGNTSLTLNFSNPLNANRGVNVTFTPIRGDETDATTAVQAGQSKTLSIPGSVTEQTVRIDTDVTEKDSFSTHTYRGDGQTVSIMGNLYPSAFVINVSDEAGLPVQQKAWNTSKNNTHDITVRGGQTRGEATVEIFGGSSTASNEISGIWKGTDPQFTIDNESAPSTVSVKLTGNVTTQQESVTGKLSGGLVTYFVEGNLPGQATVIEFNGGVPINTTVTSESMSLSGQNGTREVTRRVYKVDQSGKYRLDMTLNAEKNPSLVTGGYIINSGRENVAKGSSESLVPLEKGDYVYVWLKTKRDTVGGEKSYSDNSPVIVQDTIVSDTNIQPGESVTVYADLYNPSANSAGKEAALFQDADKLTSFSTSVGSGETKRVELGTVTFDTEGAHTVSVSEGKQVVVEVGDPPDDYGVGSMETNFVRVGETGTVKVDTEGDGSLDCAVSADGGKCVLGEVPQGSNTLVVAQEGVKKTRYTLSYTERLGARGVSVDTDGDGEPDMSHSGVLRDGQTLDRTFKVDAGETRVDINTENGGDVPYEVTWTEAAVVKNPVVYLDGERVVSDVGNFKGSRTFEIGRLSAGEHTLRFASDGEGYMARVKWTEQGDNRFPTAELNGQVVCQSADFADDQKCAVDPANAPPGTHTLSFDGGADTFNYGIAQTAQATPKRLTLTMNDFPTLFQRASADTVRADGSWARTKTSTRLENGQNTISMDAPNINGIPASASASISYTFTVTPPQNPRVVVVNGDEKQYSQTVPDSTTNANGILSSKATIELPAKWFTEGENTLYLVSENGGVYEVTVSAPTSAAGENITLEAPP